MKNERWILLWMAVANKALNEAEDWGVNDCKYGATTSHDRGISLLWNSILGGHWFESRQFSAFLGRNNQSTREQMMSQPIKIPRQQESPPNPWYQIPKVWIVGNKSLNDRYGTMLLNKQTGADAQLSLSRPLGHCSSSSSSYHTGDNIPTLCRQLEFHFL